MTRQTMMMSHFNMIEKLFETKKRIEIEIYKLQLRKSDLEKIEVLKLQLANVLYQLEGKKNGACGQIGC